MLPEMNPLGIEANIPRTRECQIETNRLRSLESELYPSVPSDAQDPAPPLQHPLPHARGLRTDGFRRNDVIKTANRENPNSRYCLCNQPSKWGGRHETPSLIHRGWKARKVPAMGEVFFLTFPFIELHRPYPTFGRRMKHSFGPFPPQ